MKFIVTGGRGFIGSHFVEKCLEEGHKVIDIDSMTYAANDKLPAASIENLPASSPLIDQETGSSATNL